VRQSIRAPHRTPRLAFLAFFTAALQAENGPASTLASDSGSAHVESLKITILSAMLADGRTLGEWGFSALVEADGHRIPFDTGAPTDVVLRNAAALKRSRATSGWLRRRANHATDGP